MNALPRWNSGNGWTYPLSHLLKADVRAIFQELIPDPSHYEDIFHGYEYRMSLLHERTNASYSGAYHAMPGEYVGEQGWSWDDRNVPLAEIGFRDAGQRVPDWPWVGLLGGEDNYDQWLIDHRGVLATFKYHNMR